MTTLESLQIRFPHLFGNGGMSSAQFFRGWAPALVSVCEEIDTLLDGQRGRFQWKALGEAKGKPRLEYWLQGRVQYVEDVLDSDGRPSVSSLTVPGIEMIDQIDGIVREAQQRLSASCMVCGGEAKTSLYGGRYVTVCASHAADRLNGPTETGLSGLVRQTLEGAPPTGRSA